MAGSDLYQVNLTNHCLPVGFLSPDNDFWKNNTLYTFLYGNSYLI